MAATKLETLSYEFFREFARYEYCLKAVGLRENSHTAKASWAKYAVEVANVIENPQELVLSDAITLTSSRKNVAAKSRDFWQI
ncbi:hypothetical protein [Chromobacterium vaccinii]|uniref:hypothetical protein n=1 Tax=Chromobacterium vaccinii TaxID=1108595 RepID=UPI0011AB5050|nr:hypothetical protein [Chromobacterium vaccinii]